MIDPISGAAPPPDAKRTIRVVAGMGMRGQARGADLLHLLDACLAEAGLERGSIAALTTVDRKAAHPALREVAETLGVPILPVVASALPVDVPNAAARVARLVGLPSIAEAAALSFGPLLIEKQSNATATCALSRLAGGYDPVAPSASNAVSIVPTSVAGP